jgi:hypothetical protein
MKKKILTILLILLLIIIWTFPIIFSVLVSNYWLLLLYLIWNLPAGIATAIILTIIDES